MPGFSIYAWQVFVKFVRDEGCALKQKVRRLFATSEFWQSVKVRRCHLISQIKTLCRAYITETIAIFLCLIKQITLKKSLGKWYAMIVTDFIQVRNCGEKEIGIDLGINNYIMDSEGNSIAHPKTIDKYADELKTAQQDLSRKKKGSHNRSKARFRVAKVHEKIERVRNDFLHKLSNQYVKDCKLIVVENLAIKDMMQSSYNAKNIADASWNRFIQFLCYKAESAGCKVEKINPKNTTKQCSNCGNLQKMPLWIRTYKCSSCGFEIDRDLNSAINIKSKFIGSERANVENNSSVQIEQELSMKQEAITSTGVRL